MKSKIWVVADIKGSIVFSDEKKVFRGFTNYERARQFYEKTTDLFGFGIIEVDIDESKPTENHTDRFKEI